VRKKSFQNGPASSPGNANASSKVGRYVVRIAAYDSSTVPPRTRDITSADPGLLVEEAALAAFQEIQAHGGHMPFAAIREVVENLAHAGFRGASVSVLEGGAEVVVADRGDGIASAEDALRPGFSTARGEMRGLLRGVGSGLGLAANLMSGVGGSLVVESNLGEGTVVTLRAPGAGARVGGVEGAVAAGAVLPPGLGERRKQVLLVMADGRESGPSTVAQHVGSSLATAFRDLVSLEQMGLVQYVGRGKRVVTAEGLQCVAVLLQGPVRGGGG
jgi:hypothetical protein